MLITLIFQYIFALHSHKFYFFVFFCDEKMSADYFVDEDYDIYLFEFNTSPVLKDPQDSPEVRKIQGGICSISRGC